jgi:hypothetical protein
MSVEADRCYGSWDLSRILGFKNAIVLFKSGSLSSLVSYGNGSLRCKRPAVASLQQQSMSRLSKWQMLDLAIQPITIQDGLPKMSGTVGTAPAAFAPTPVLHF